ncbi:MAG: sugar phosphate nucleotidyltransferase, partial [Patescibacteria group bacterium]
TGQSKRAIEDHFDYPFELAHRLREQHKGEELLEVERISELANFVYVRQKGPYGNATPVLNSRHLITNEPFAVLFGDEMFSGAVPRLKQMIETYERYGDPVLGVIPVDDEGTKRYGIIDPAAEVEPGVFQLKGMVEKPGPEKAPSRLAAIGAYVLTPDIFDAIAETKRGHGGELILLDAIFTLMKTRPVYATVLKGEYHDTGSKIGWLKANIAEALRRPDMRDETRTYLKKASKA